MDLLSSYIPMDRRHAMLADTSLPDRAEGAALFVDVSGFVPLTEALASTFGPQRGAEELSLQLDRVYGAIIGEVHRYGASVIGFSGDALTCWFDASTPRCAAGVGAGSRAIACALAMQAAMKPVATIATAAGTTVSLAVKVAVAAGPARRLLVGDPAIQTLEVVAGATLDEVAAAEQLAERDEVLVNQTAIAELGEAAIVSAWRRVDPRSPGFAVVTGLARTVPATPWPELSPEDGARIAARARPWLLPAIYERLERGHGQFLAEQRPTVAWFLSFGGIDYDGDDGAGAKLDAYVRWIQSVMARYQGALLGITIGDKGSYVHGAFGAPVAHDDDPARAALAALELLQAAPSDLRFVSGVRIGLARGQMYAGASGSSTRRVYVVIGAKVNLAARLMQAAPSGEVWTDPETARAAEGRCRFEALPAIAVKGIRDPVPVYRAEPLAALPEGPDMVVGRAAERAQLNAALHDLAANQSRVILVQGEPGIGKSRLMAALQGDAEHAGFTCLRGGGDAIERSTPYHAWRPVFAQLFHLDRPADRPGSRAGRQPMQLSALHRSRVLALLAQLAPELAPLAPLLNAVLPLDLPETDLTRQLSGEGRAENTQKLLVGLLAAAARTAGLLLILEDAHFLDSASWALARRAGRDVRPGLLVISMQPPDAAVSADLRQLLSLETTTMVLEALSPAAIEVLVCSRLGVRRLAEPVAQFISERGEGNPLFSEELAYALRDAGLVAIADGECQLAAGVTSLYGMAFPDTIKGVITSRFDRLSPAHQLALKSASVIGRVFEQRPLCDIYPIPSEVESLPGHLRTLASLDITPVARPEPDLTYMFKHIVAQEAAYQLMAFAQRRQLHRAVAEWYERVYADDLSPFYSLLAHHWRSAEVPAKAITYFERAGERALHNSAYQEASSCFGAILELHAGAATKADGLAGNARQPRWNMKLAQAYRGWGHFEDSRAHVETAARLYAHAVPHGRAALGLQLLRELHRQVRHRLRPAAHLGRVAAAERETCLEEAQLYSLLAELGFFANQGVLCLYATVRCLNLNESAGSSAQLATAYAAGSLLSGIFGLHRLAETYYERGLAIARALDQPGVLADVQRLNSVYCIGVGRWARVRERAGQAREIHQRLSDDRAWGDCMTMLAHAAFLTGDFAGCEQLCADLAASAQRTGIRMHQLWALTWRGESAARLGRLDEAGELLEAALRLAAGEPEINVEVCGLAHLALIHQQRGDLERARAAADDATRRLAQIEAEPGTYAMIDGYGALADVYLGLWRAAGGNRSAAARELRRAARQACRRLGAHARRFPIGVPAAWLHRGGYAALAGHPRRARRAWQRSLAEAERLAMPFERARAHLELARCAPPGDAARVQHLTQAGAIFEQLGTPHELAQVCSERDRANLARHTRM